MGPEPSIKTQVGDHPTVPPSDSRPPGGPHTAQPTARLSTVVAASPADGSSAEAAIRHVTATTERDGRRPQNAVPGTSGNATLRVLPERDRYPSTSSRRSQPDGWHPHCRHPDKPWQSRAERRRTESDRAETAVGTVLLCLLLGGAPVLVVDGLEVPVPTGTLIWMSVALPVLVCIGGPVGYGLYRHLRAFLVGHQPRHAASPTAPAPTDRHPSTPGNPRPPSLGQRLAESTVVARHPAPPASGR